MGPRLVAVEPPLAGAMGRVIGRILCPAPFDCTICRSARRPATRLECTKAFCYDDEHGNAR